MRFGNNVIIKRCKNGWRSLDSTHWPNYFIASFQKCPKWLLLQRWNCRGVKGDNDKNNRTQAVENLKGRNADCNKGQVKGRKRIKKKALCSSSGNRETGSAVMLLGLEKNGRRKLRRAPKTRRKLDRVCSKVSLFKNGLKESFWWGNRTRLVKLFRLSHQHYVDGWVIKLHCGHLLIKRQN